MKSAMFQLQPRKLICVARSHDSVLLRQTQVSSKANFLLIGPSEKYPFSVRKFRRYEAVKNRFIIYFGEYEAKESVGFCAHEPLEWTEWGPAACLLKGHVSDETNVRDTGNDCKRGISFQWCLNFSLDRQREMCYPRNHIRIKEK